MGTKTSWIGNIPTEKEPNFLRKVSMEQAIIPNFIVFFWGGGAVFRSKIYDFCDIIVKCN